MRPIDRIPARVKYYLLSHKDKNMDAFMKAFPGKSLVNLTLEELQLYFTTAVTSDSLFLKELSDEAEAVANNECNENICPICYGTGKCYDGYQGGYTCHNCKGTGQM